MENKIGKILDKYDQFLETIVEDLTEAGFDSACHFISHVNPNIRVSFVYRDSEVDECTQEEDEEPPEAKTVSGECAKRFLGYLDTDIEFKDIFRREIMSLAGELDETRRELKLLQYKPLYNLSYKPYKTIDQMIEDGEL